MRNNGNNFTTAIQWLVDDRCLHMAETVVAINFVLPCLPAYRVIAISNLIY
jgi:hypothetical protein